MPYFISWLEGIITFISPCLLPMLPVYVSYFAGSRAGTGRTFLHALCFVAGFTLVFVLMGALAGSLGALLVRYQALLNIVTGAIVVMFGLSYLGILPWDFFRGPKAGWLRGGETGKGMAFVFGIVFAVGWTPCVGVFLGSALMLASQQASLWRGIGMLFCYSLGLGLPFLVSALLLQQLKQAFEGIKKHYRVVTIISGCLLLGVGFLMMTGTMGRWLRLLSIY